MSGLDPKRAREQALANIKLEGFNITPEFETIYNDFADNKISQLEAFRRLGINVDQIPAEKREELEQMFMSDIHNRAFEQDK